MGGPVLLCSCAQMARAMAGTDGGHRWRGPWCKVTAKKQQPQRARALLWSIVGHIAPARPRTL